VREPDLLLLDEPFSALDALTRIAIHRLVLDLWTLHQPGVLLVTHDVDEALQLADRVVVLGDGRIAHTSRIDAPRPRRHDHPDLIALRQTLLATLGVAKEGTA
jgi:sulfonate transport system ATP-binding protein